jgi:predicted  nucleic acid-binding Zn-ribbon protein
MKWLLELQELDQELARLHEDVQRFTPAIDGVKRERARRAASLQSEEKRSTELAAQRRKLESDLTEAESRVQKFRNQQQQVRTAKEAEALEHEAKAASDIVEKLEEQILDLLDKEQQLTKDHASSAANIAEAEKLAIAEQRRLVTLRTEKEELAKTLQGDRIAAFNKLPEDLRDTYEWLRKKHGPTAVARVREGACGGCGNLLVAQMAFRAKSEAELVQCPNCQRYLTGSGSD